MAKQPSAKSSSKRARANTAGDVVDQDPSTTAPPLAYVESDASDNDAVLSEEEVDYSTPIIWLNTVYQRSTKMTKRFLAKKNLSPIWRFNRGFEMISQKDGKTYYYCRQCIDKKKDLTYEPIC